MVNHYRNILLEELSSMWSTGRRRCEYRSLTGHYCKYPYHEDNEHCTDFISTGACNCGKARTTREDPFNLKYANCDFFKARCCDSLKSIELPLIHGNFNHWALTSFGSNTNYNPKVGMPQDGFKLKYKFLIPYEMNNQRNENSIAGWIGYEYECYMGHRFIETLNTVNMYAKSNVNDHLSIENAFKVQMPMYAPCRSANKHQHVQETPMAQLQRIFLTTPTNINLKINPKVQMIAIINREHQKVAFTLGNLVSIPSGEFLCLRIPYVYEYNEIPLTLRNIPSPDKCTFQLVG